MRKIKSLFRQLTLTSDFDKALVNIECSEQYSVPTEDVICKLMDALHGENPYTPKEKAENELFSMLSKSHNWDLAQKLLFVSHKLIHKMKLNFAFQFYNHDFYADLKTALQLLIFVYYLILLLQGDEVHIPIALKYAEFLRSISKQYRLFYECEQYSENGRKLYFGYSQHPHFCAEECFQSKKMINEGAIIQLIAGKIQLNLHFSLSKFKKYPIMQQMALMYISDCTKIYNFLSAVIEKLKDKILTSSNSESSLNIYSVYEEVVMLTKDMEKLYQLNVFVQTVKDDPSNQLIKPKYFKVEVESNRTIELHINRIKASLDSSSAYNRNKLSNSGKFKSLTVQSFKNNILEFNDNEGDSSNGFIDRQFTKQIQTEIAEGLTDLDKEKIQDSQTAIHSNLSNAQGIIGNDEQSFMARKFRRSQPDGSLASMIQSTKSTTTVSEKLRRGHSQSNSIIDFNFVPSNKAQSQREIPRNPIEQEIEMQ